MLSTENIEECVDLVVERQWHVGSHAKALAEQGWLGMVYGGFPAFRYIQTGIPASALRTHAQSVLWNHLVNKLLGGNQFQANEPKALARWVARKRKLNRYVVCYATAYQYLFPVLCDKGHILVLERGSTHPLEYWDRLRQASLENGLPYADQPSQKLLDEVAAGQMAHFIGAGSRLIADSYEQRGYSPDRILLVPYGVDHRFFSERQRDESPGKLRIACVGIIGLRKGLPRLVRIASWAKRVGLDIEILLVGPLQTEAALILANAPDNIHAVGVKKGSDLVELLHRCHLYCLPSYEEGFGISVLEAMSTGLPVIISEETGAREAIRSGENGLVLKWFTDDEFDSQLAPLFTQPEIRNEMGRAARRTIESEYTLAHYGQKLAAEYRRMFGIVQNQGARLEAAVLRQ